MEYALAFFLLGSYIVLSAIIVRQYERIQSLTTTSDVFFEIYKDKSSAWRWRLRSNSDQEILAASNQGFPQIEKVQEDIERIISTNKTTKVVIIKE